MRPNGFQGPSNQRNAPNAIQQTAQTMQSINTRQQQAYLKSQQNQSPPDNNKNKNSKNKGDAADLDGDAQQPTQTIYNVDTPKKAYNF